MTSLTEFFNKHEDDTLKGITRKNSINQRNNIAHLAVHGECTLSEHADNHETRAGAGR